jgi:hypothetical protein
MLIIASCSSKKRIKPANGLDESAPNAFDLNAFATKWVATVRGTKVTTNPNNMYAGVGFVAIRNAVEYLNADVKFLSAGMSLVDSNQNIPSYNLTINNNGGPTPFAKVDVSGNSNDWWNALNRAYGYQEPIYNAIKQHDGFVYIALPALYLEMVKPELVKVVNEFPHKIRIISSTKIKVGDALAKVTIRYDQRLNKLENGPSGANASFSQRALLHFSRVIKDNHAEYFSASEQQGLVDNYFKNIDERKITKRAKISEEELVNHVQKALHKKLIPRSKLLENLRQIDGIACEQSRFYRVYDQVTKLSA